MKYSNLVPLYNNFNNIPPYLIERKLKEILHQIPFVKASYIKIRIDKDGLYSYYRDNFYITITILNPIYVAHLLEEDETIDIILRSIVPRNYDLYVDASYVDE